MWYLEERQFKYRGTKRLKLKDGKKYTIQTVSI